MEFCYQQRVKKNRLSVFIMELHLIKWLRVVWFGREKKTSSCSSLSGTISKETDDKPRLSVEIPEPHVSLSGAHHKKYSVIFVEFSFYDFFPSFKLFTVRRCLYISHILKMCEFFFSDYQMSIMYIFHDYIEEHDTRITGSHISRRQMIMVWKGNG